MIVLEGIRSQVNDLLVAACLVGKVSLCVNAELWQHSRGRTDGGDVDPVSWRLSMLAPSAWGWGNADGCNAVSSAEPDELLEWAKKEVKEMVVAQETAELKKELLE